MEYTIEEFKNKKFDDVISMLEVKHGDDLGDGTVIEIISSDGEEIVVMDCNEMIADYLIEDIKGLNLTIDYVRFGEDYYKDDSIRWENEEVIKPFYYITLNDNQKDIEQKAEMKISEELILEAKQKTFELYKNKKMTLAEVNEVLETIENEMADSLNCLILRTHDFYNENCHSLCFETNDIKDLNTGELIRDDKLKILILDTYKKMNYEYFRYKG